MNKKEIDQEIKRYEEQGFDDWQIYEIRKGLETDIDVSVYANLNLTDDEMQQKREALEMAKQKTAKLTGQSQKEEEIENNKIDKNEFTYGQQRQIDLGLENKINVGKYANPQFDSFKMEQIRWKLEKEKELKLEI